MKNQLLHTPDGVRDIYNGECKKKLELQNNLLTSLHEFGYQDIQTPSFEYFDVFGNQIGTTPSRDLYKFFDKNGNTLVLRPDFTPSIARCAVKYYMDDDMPVKLCYMGNTFTNSSGTIQRSNPVWGRIHRGCLYLCRCGDSCYDR